jgi:hypothetical protein
MISRLFYIRTDIFDYSTENTLQKRKQILKHGQAAVAARTGGRCSMDRRERQHGQVGGAAWTGERGSMDRRESLVYMMFNLLI